MPLVLAIFEVLARPAEENDQAAALEKQMLRRSYFAFIMTIAASGMNEVMANQGELQTDVSVTVSPDGAAQPGAEVKLWTERLDHLNSDVFLFSGAENIERVVFTIIQGAVDFPDPIAQKTCFITLSKLVELWGESLHPPCLHHYSSSQHSVSVLMFCCLLIGPAGGKDGMVGFPDFIYKHIVPACFLAPLKPTFDLSDAQTVLVSFCSRVQPADTRSDVCGQNSSCSSLCFRRCQSVHSL